VFGVQGWDELTIDEKRAMSEKKARSECLAQGVPFDVTQGQAEALGRLLAGFDRQRQTTSKRSAA
jgi:hypothetical protein